MPIAQTCQVCEFYRAETEDFLTRKGLADKVTIQVMPALCVSGRETDSKASIEGYGVFGSACPRTPGKPRQQGGKALGPGGCLELIAPDWLLENLVREGAYLVSPGWLADWERHVGSWGFEPEGLRSFAQESMKSICLLDTLVIPGIERQLSEMAAALGLPSLRIPIGMDYFDTHSGAQFREPPITAATPTVTAMMTGVSSTSAPVESETIGQGPTGNSRVAADYAMALDLLATLNHFQTESDIIQELLNIITMLFAPRDLYLVRYADRIPTGMIYPFQEESAIDATTASMCADFERNSRISGLGNGLVIPLDFRDQRLALVFALNFEMPDRMDGYRNLMESILPICSLSLSNARNFEGLLWNEVMLRRKQEELLESLKLRDRLLSIISHDLRGPLGSMGELLRFLAEDLNGSIADSPKLMLTEITLAADNINLLLHNLLEWAKAQNSTIALRPEPLDIRELVQETFNLLQSQALIKNLVFYNQIPDGFIIQADSNALQTVLRNLVSNAMKFTKAGGSVRLTGTSEQGRQRIEVIDTGVGMDTERLAQAMDFSRRYSSQGTQGERGSGLGLVLCHDLTKKCGGEMHIDSEPGKGTTATLIFPD